MPVGEKHARTDAGLASELRVAVMRLRRRLISERHPDNPLSTNAMAVLGNLHRNGEQTIGELAAHERVKAPSMTRTVKCLEEGGFVVRRPHDSDRRQVVVALTEQGAAMVLADRKRRDEWLARQLRTLTADERDVLRRAAPILERLSRKD